MRTDVRVTKNESNFPYMEDNTPKCIKLYFDKLNEKTDTYERWRHREYVANPNGSRGGYINSLILSGIEALVHVMAHELRHLWQKNHTGKRGKVWGARGKLSNRAADAYAMRKTREWCSTKIAKTDALEFSSLLWNQLKD